MDITTAPAEAVAYKYADPIEDARWIYDEVEADHLAIEGAPIEWLVAA